VIDHGDKEKSKKSTGKKKIYRKENEILLLLLI